ncbi:RidA family protein [Aspergillus mulundensis]|uniref:Putative L-PSP endoribonuclease family protein n=1 Tax=Aspergillus mulundensis TaxID=1810919 RepID=A0A3D8RXS9_9EURO|nr:putative L-PSP endoribonuclease family protein [Aspergillus mulundensis]RDW78862.1 putative L-PSP endoribonuclease family protein [Aspergillus mulundensis]
MTSPNGHPYLLNPSAPPSFTRYPHARLVSPSQKTTIYISGIAPVTPDGQLEGVTTNPDGTWSADIRVQTAAVLRRIGEIIHGASGGKADLHNVVDAVVYLTDTKSQYSGMNEEWNKVWRDRESAPARATVGVRELPDERFLVEVKATAIF